MMEFTYQNYPYIHLLVVHFLHTYPAFQMLFVDKVPEQEANVRSLIYNPNCSCKFKIEKYSLENADLCKEMIQTFIKDNNISFDLNQFTKDYFSKTTYSGKIVETTVENWPKLAEKIQKDGVVFKGFSVVVNPDKTLTVFFL